MAEVAIGSRLYFASALATAKQMTAITNASEAVATLEASHGVAQLDWLAIATSGWADALDRVLRAKTVATNDVTLEGFNTLDTAIYPAAGGAGTIKEITWTELTDISGLDTSGGEQQFADGSDLRSVYDTELPSNITAGRYVFTINDKPDLAWYPLLRAISGIDGYPMRMVSKSGKTTALNGTWSFVEFPRLSRTETIKVQAVFAAKTRTLIRYTS